MIRAQTLIGPADVALMPDGQALSGGFKSVEEAIGLEARVNLYEGRPIRPGDLGPPAIVERNQIVALNYHHAGLSIRTEGRALDRAGAGERLRVMNIKSRTTVTGTVLVDGSVNVAPF